MHTPRLMLLVICVAIVGCGGKQAPPTSSSAAMLTRLSSTDALAGKQGFLSISFDNPVVNDTTVMLSTSSSAVATLPASAIVLKGENTVTVTYNAVSVGSAAFTATNGSAALIANVTVVDKARLTGLSNGSPLEKGAIDNGSIGINFRTPTPITVTLASSDTTIATVPATVTVPAWSSFTRFDLNAGGDGLAQLTATLGDSTSIGSVLVVDKAHLSPISPPAHVEVGGVLHLSVDADATVAKTTTVQTTVDNPGVVTVDPIVIPADGAVGSFAVHAVAAGSANVTFTLNGSTTSMPITVVTAAHLQSFTVNPLSIGQFSYQSISFDAALAHDALLTLTSSDPTIASFPSHLVVNAGGAFASFGITGLAPGKTTLTVTYNGTSIEAPIVVTPVPVTLSLSDSTLVVGATETAQVPGGASTTITVGDPKIISASQPANGTVTVTALAPGQTTLTATSSAGSQTIPVTVVAQASFALSSGRLAVGEMQSEYMYVSAIEPLGKTVTFTSSNPDVIAAPAPTWFTFDSRNFFFSLVGLKTGSAIITATVDGVSASAVYYVGASSTPPVYMLPPSVSSPCLEVGARVNLGISLSTASSSDTTITLTPSPANIVSLPSTVTVPAGQSFVNVPVSGMAAGSVTIGLSAGGITNSASLMVVQNATLSLNLATSVTAGGFISGSVGSSCALANSISIPVMSSNKAFLTVSPATIVLAPTSNPSTASLECTGVAAGTATVSLMPPTPYAAPAAVSVTVN